MHYHVVPVDIESVRVQLCNELNRSVTDLDVFAWLRRCGCVEHDGRWVVHAPPLSPLRMINSKLTVPASA